MQKAVNPPEIDKCAILRQVLDRSSQNSAFFQMLQGLTFLGVLLLFEDLLAGDHNISALLVQLDDRHIKGLTLQTVQIPDRTKICLRTGQEGAGA